MKRRRRNPAAFHADYTVYPLGWRGQHFSGKPNQRGTIVVCPKCGRRGLTVPGWWMQLPIRNGSGHWFCTRILHKYPTWRMGKPLCFLFDKPPKEML